MVIFLSLFQFFWFQFFPKVIAGQYFGAGNDFWADLVENFLRFDVPSCITPMAHWFMFA